MSDYHTLLTDNPAIKGRENDYTTITVDLHKVLQSWKLSLFSFEWLSTDGKLLAIKDLPKIEHDKYMAVCQSLDQKDYIPRPILGIGMMDNIEIGSRRDVLLTLYSKGLRTLDVHIKKNDYDEMRDFVVKQDVSQAGSILLYIIIAIGLLAGLTYALSSGSRQNTSTITDQQARLAAQEIIDYGNSVAAAVQKLKLRGVKDTEFSFGNDVYQRNDGTSLNPPGHNPNCTHDGCEIFSIDGGGITPFISEAIVENTVAGQHVPGHFALIKARIAGIGTDDAYNLVLYTTNLKKKVCSMINTLVGVNNPSGNPPSLLDTATGNIYDGTYPADGTGSEITHASIDGRPTFCYEKSSAAGRYIYNQVLIAR